MRPTRVFALLTLALAGCKTCSTDCGHGPAACQESIVVKAPQQKVIVETPPAAPVGAGQPVGAVPQAVGAGQPVALVPQGLGAQMPVAPFGAGMPLGAPVALGAGATVRERTGLGLVFDHFNIPIPFPRLIAVPKPSEVTFQVPPNNGVGFGAPMMPACMPMGMGMPIAQAGFGAPVAMGAAPQVFIQQPQAVAPLGVAQQPVQVVQQPVAVAAPAPVAAPPVAAAPTVVTDHQCDEIIQKCHVLKRLHQLRQHACDAACCPK